jgi:RimJ/RimL family protein N-acetyltransferase
VLSDGGRGAVRRIRHTDRSALLKFLHGLSANTCLRRGWSPLNAGVIDGMARNYLRRSGSPMDGVLLMSAADELVGLAEYRRISQGKQCEIALVIADRWQGRKAGTLLLAAAAGSARRAGYECAILDMALDNARMLAAARRLGFVPTQIREGRRRMEKAL